MVDPHDEAETDQNIRWPRWRFDTVVVTPSSVECDMTDDVDLTIVTLTFDAVDPAPLLSVLSKYVVISRGHPGCRNIDLAASATRPNRFVLIEKWETAADQQQHFDSDEMVEMARGCDGLLQSPPQIDLLDAISAHDLR